MRFILCILTIGISFAQTTRYPGAVDNDSSLFVVSDNVQTTLNAAMGTADTAAVVASGTGFVPNMVATICDTTTNTGKCTAWEHMLVTAVSGNVLTVTRGFAGTSARSHSSGRLVSVLIDSAHQKVLKDAIVAVQTALGPNLSNIGASSGLLTAGAFSFSAYSCNGSSTCAPAGTSGMSLIAGNNTLTMTPVPAGVNGTDTGHGLYISGGTGTAEACTITGGSGTSGQASGQIIINCANSHSGSWTLQTSSGGLQEAICSLGSTGGQVAVTTAITLRGNVTNCGKTAVTVNKWSGTTITNGAFTIFGMAPLTFAGSVAPDSEVFQYGGTTYACPECPGGTPRPATYPITFQGGGTTPYYQQTDSMMLIGRSTADSIGTSSGLSRNTLTVHTDYKGASGTAVGIESLMLVTGNTAGNGSPAIAGYMQSLAGTTSEQIGVHGQCDVKWAVTGSPPCIAFNAEGSLGVAAGSGSAILIGIESNMNTASPAGATAAVLGVQVQMNNANNNMAASSTGIDLRANSGTVPKGLYVLDSGGAFTNPVVISTSLNPSTSIALLSAAPGLVDGANSIGFYRGSISATSLVAAIQADNTAADFGTGTMTLKTALSGVLSNTLVLNSNGRISIAGGGAASKAVCWGADGKTLGRCATVVDATGGCTCTP